MTVSTKRFFRLNVTAAGLTSNPGTEIHLYEIQLQSAAGNENNFSGFGGNIPTGPNLTAGSYGALLDNNYAAGTTTIIPVAFNAPMIIDLGAGNSSNYSTNQLVFNVSGAGLSSDSQYFQVAPSSFTLDAGDSATGPWSNVLTVTNDNTASGYGGYASSQGKTFVLNAGTTALTVAGTAGAGTVGTSYSAQFTASGGTSPYTYSVGSGSLPAGTTLNSSTGLVSGTPTAAGNSTFVIHAVDSTT